MKLFKRLINFDKFESIGLMFLAIAVYCWLFFLNQTHLEGIPHVGDAVSYVWQAKFLSLGKIFVTPMEFPQYYDFFKGWEPLFFRDGKYFGPYPFGHPLLLVPGVLLGSPGLMPPLIGTSMVLCLYFIIKKIVSWEVALLGMILAISSPFFQMHSASFMSHNSAALYLSASIFLLILLSSKHQMVAMIMSGVLFGLLLNTRPLASIAFFPTIILFCIYFTRSIKAVLLFLGGFGLPVLFYLISNFILTGNAVSPPYSVYLVPMKTAFPLLVAGKLTVEVGNFQRASKLFLEVVNGWPIGFTLLLPILSFLNKRLLMPVMFIWLGIISHMTLHFFFYDPGITYGPRMWYELFPLFIIVLTIGIHNVTRLMSQNYLAKYVLLTLIFLLVVRSSIGWVTGSPVLYSYYFTPSSIQGLKTFNYIDARLINKAKKLNLHNAVVFVKSNEYCDYQWWCYGSVMAQNNTTYDTDIVWAIDLGVRNVELKQLYPDRSFYQAIYNTGEITPLAL